MYLYVDPKKKYFQFAELIYRWWRHPKIKENYKTVCGAILLTVVGAGKLSNL